MHALTTSDSFTTSLSCLHLPARRRRIGDAARFRLSSKQVFRGYETTRRRIFHSHRTHSPDCATREILYAGWLIVSASKHHAPPLRRKTSRESQIGRKATTKRIKGESSISLFNVTETSYTRLDSVAQISIHMSSSARAVAKTSCRPQYVTISTVQNDSSERSLSVRSQALSSQTWPPVKTP